MKVISRSFKFSEDVESYKIEYESKTSTLTLYLYENFKEDIQNESSKQG